jgi:ATP-dependent DNA helicase RecG
MYFKKMLAEPAGTIGPLGASTLNIIDWCAENSNPPPSWQEQAGSVYVTFLPADLPEMQRGTGEDDVSGDIQKPGYITEVTGEVTGEVPRLLAAMHGDMSRVEIQAALNLRHEDYFRAAYLVPALKTGLIEMTIPDKPRSSKQKYRLTGKGEKWLEGKSL